MKGLDILNRLSVGRAFVLGMALAAIYYFLMFDSGANHLSSISASQRSIQDLQKQIAVSQAKLDRAEVFRKTAAETGSAIGKLLAAIPENFGVRDLEKIVSNETKVAGASLMNVAPLATGISGFSKEFEELGVTVDLNGTFLQQMIFLSSLTKTNQILIVRKIAMGVTTGSRTEDSTMTHMVAEIVALRYRGSSKPDAGDHGTPVPPAPAPPGGEK